MNENTFINTPGKASRMKNGHIRLRKDDRYEGQYYFMLQRKSVYGKSEDEVRIKLNNIINAILQKTYIDGSMMPLFVYLSYWLREHNDIKPSTRKSYTDYVERHIALSRVGSIPLKHLECSDLQQFFDQKARNGRLDGKGGLSPKTIRNMRSMISEALKHAVYPLKYIQQNPMEAVRIAKVEIPEMRFLEDFERLQLIDAARHYSETDINALWVIVDLFTGFRIGEMTGFMWKDFSRNFDTIRGQRTMQRLYIDLVKNDPKYTRVYMQKTCPNAKTALYVGPPKTPKSKRGVPLPVPAQEAVKRIKAYQESKGIHNKQDFAVLYDRGDPMEPKAYQVLYSKILKLAGLDINFHGLRHTFATTLRDILGQSDPATLQRYIHTAENRKRKLMDKFNDYELELKEVI